MKKLLALLGGVTLISPISASVVACGNSYDQKDTDGSSILANVTIDGNKVSITSTDVLKELINSSGPENRNQLMLEFLQVLAASILLNYDKLPDAGGYVNANEKENLKTDLDQLKKDVDYEIQTEKDQYKDDNGKKWEDAWYDMLKGKYNGIDDHAELDKKYWQEKFISGTNNNALKVLQNNLLSRYQQNVVWRSTPEIVASELQTLINFYNSNNNSLDGFSASSSTNRTRAITLINSTRPTDGTEDFTFDDENKSDDDLDKQLENIFSGDTSTWAALIISEAPQDTKGYATGAFSTGMISNSQRYFLNHYFENEKPVSVSTIKFAFSSGGTWDDGISSTDFTANGTDYKIAKDIIDVIRSITTDGSTTNNTNWDLMLSQGSISGAVPTNNGNGTVTKNSTLMTLDDTSAYDDLTREAVYEYLAGNSNIEPLTALSGSDNETDINTITNALNRSGEDKMVAEVSPGVLALINDDGLNLIRIDGYDEITGTNTTDLSKNSANNISDKLKELELFNKFSNFNSDNKLYVMQNSSTSDGVDGVKYESLNSQFNDSYLKYLVNNSMVASETKSISSFNIMDSLNSYVSLTAPSTETGTYVWWTAYLDYFKQIMSDENGSEITTKDFIDSFITFNELPGDLSDDGNAWSLEDWFVSHADSASQTVQANPIVTFNSSINKFNEEVDNYASPKPKGKLSVSDLSSIAGIPGFINEDGSGNSNPEDYSYDNVVNEYISNDIQPELLEWHQQANLQSYITNLTFGVQITTKGGRK